MKKNLLLLLSMLLIIGMGISMLTAKFSHKGGTGKESIEVMNKKQNLRINIGTEPPTLNPGLASDSISKSVLYQLFEGLTRIDQWGQRVNGIANVIKISDDQKTYTFSLRDAKWSNGDPVIAKDFEYAWKWELDPKHHSPNAYQLYILKGAKEYNEGNGKANDVGVKALDGKTLEVTLTDPIPNFLERITASSYFPINSKIAKQFPDWANDAGLHYTSNGPFELTRWSHGDRIILSKNNDYPDANSVVLKSINMSMINDPYTELVMFEDGKLDWAGSPRESLPIDEVDLPTDNDKLQTQQMVGTYTFRLNTKMKPFNNQNIRKALALAIDRKKIVDNVVQGKQIPAKAIVPPTLLADNKKGYFKDNDPVEAKQFLQKGLEELGYKDVSQIPVITISVSKNELDQNIALALQEMWKDNLGIRTTIIRSDWKTQLDNVKSLHYQVAQMEEFGDYNDTISLLEMYQGASYNSNGTGWENKDFQDLLNQAQKEQDPNKRQSQLKKAESILMEEMPIIPLYFYDNEWLQNENLKNVASSGFTPVQFKWAYFAKEQKQK